MTSTLWFNTCEIRGMRWLSMPLSGSACFVPLGTGICQAVWPG